MYLARPLDDTSGAASLLPWIDTSDSEILARKVVDSAENRWYPGRFYEDAGLRGGAYLLAPSLGRVERLRGLLRWNASIPFRSSDEAMVADSFDIRPQTGVRIGFENHRVRGDLCLRWPRLAASETYERSWWANSEESLRNLSEEWIEICRRRGAADARLLVLDTTVSPGVFRWKEPDPAVIRLVLSEGPVQVVFSGGDSVWIPVGRRADLFADLDATSSLPLLVESALSERASSSDWSGAPFGSGTWVSRATGGQAWFGLYDVNPSYERIAFTPLRVQLRIAGTCPAFDEWRRYGSTDRWHRPTGNVAPFDGYLCELFPDTLSFPRGDVALIAPDTSNQPKVVIVDSLKPQPSIATP